jgi:tight adherence protein B
VAVIAGARIVDTVAGVDAVIGGTAAAAAVTVLGGADPRTRLRRCLDRPPERAASPQAPSGRPRRARESGATAVPMPVVIDLVAAVVDAGMAPAGAIAMVAQCLSDASDPAGAVLLSPDAATTGWRALFGALELAQASGLGPVGLLRSAAAEQRRRRAQAQAVAARRLAVLAVMPTSLCLLPAFVLVTVVPLILGLLRT